MIRFFFPGKFQAPTPPLLLFLMRILFANNRTFHFLPTSEIFEVTWFPDPDEPLGGRRMVTKAFAVIGTMNPIILPKRGEKKATPANKVASGRVSKRSNRSKVD